MKSDSFRRLAPGRISDLAAINRSPPCQLRRLNAVFAHQVENLMARRQQIVADNAPVAAPPHRFRAHDGAGSFPAGGNQLLKRLPKSPAQRIVGVVMKAAVLPPAVDAGIDRGAFWPQAAQRSDMAVFNAVPFQAARQGVAIVLRVGARTRRSEARRVVK